MILPYLNYCNLVWGSAYKSNLQRIVILQKRVIRIVDKSYYNAHTDPIFKKLNLLKFQNIHLLHLGQLMFSFKNYILPRKFENIFTTNNQTPNYNTRHATSFRLPLCRTNIRQLSVFYQGPKFFNSLSPEITGSSSLASFRKKLKKFYYHQLLMLRVYKYDLPILHFTILAVFMLETLKSSRRI